MTPAIPSPRRPHPHSIAKRARLARKDRLTDEVAAERLSRVTIRQPAKRRFGGYAHFEILGTKHNA